MPILDVGPFLHPYKTGYDHGVVHPDGNFRYLQQSLHVAGNVHQLMSSLRGLTGMDNDAVFSLVYVIFTTHYPSTVIVMVLIGQVSDVLDRGTSTVAQPGVQNRISGGTHFLPLVDLRCCLCGRTQLGTRGDCKQLPGLLAGWNVVLTDISIV
jgi:hypothetical protein